VRKNIKKLIKLRKPEKNNKKNQTVTKNRLEFFKKPTGSIRFWFYKPETKKTEPNQTETGKNQAKPEKN